MKPVAAHAEARTPLLLQEVGYADLAAVTPAMVLLGCRMRLSITVLNPMYG